MAHGGGGPRGGGRGRAAFPFSRGARGGGRPPGGGPWRRGPRPRGRGRGGGRGGRAGRRPRGRRRGGERVALVPIATYILNKTTWGLKIRSVGQNPEAADSLGVSVIRVRYASVILGAALAGIAGASLSISLLNIFQENMTNGIGFIAVALVYFGSWTPLGVMIGALLFSSVNALQLWVQVLSLPIPSDVAVMLPYLLTIIALAIPFRRSLQPAALTKPFSRGEN
ncbi:MAG: ABC transporter permease [Chloroflexi bacterium]|nr:ABC transporter permease [Chloroflexota bacterium]